MVGVVLTILLLSGLCFQAYSQKRPPRFSMQLTTMDGEIHSCLLMKVNDSSVTVYPGNRGDWKFRLTPVQYNYSKIRQIRIKRRNGTIKGFFLGAFSGTVTAIAFFMQGGKCGPDPSGLGGMSVMAGSTIAGAVWGGKGMRRANINGDLNLFATFKMRFDAKH